DPAVGLDGQIGDATEVGEVDAGDPACGGGEVGVHDAVRVELGDPPGRAAGVEAAAAGGQHEARAARPQRDVPRPQRAGGGRQEHAVAVEGAVKGAVGHEPPYPLVGQHEHLAVRQQYGVGDPAEAADQLVEGRAVGVERR